MREEVLEGDTNESEGVCAFAARNFQTGGAIKINLIKGEISGLSVKENEV